MASSDAHHRIIWKVNWEITLRKHSNEPANDPATARSARKRKSNITCSVEEKLLLIKKTMHKETLRLHRLGKEKYINKIYIQQYYLVWRAY